MITGDDIGNDGIERGILDGMFPAFVDMKGLFVLDAPLSDLKTAFYLLIDQSILFDHLCPI